MVKVDHKMYQVQPDRDERLVRTHLSALVPRDMLEPPVILNPKKTREHACVQQWLWERAKSHMDQDIRRVRWDIERLMLKYGGMRISEGDLLKNDRELWRLRLYLLQLLDERDPAVRALLKSINCSPHQSLT